MFPLELKEFNSVEGSWGSWTDWSSCSGSCTEGTQKRTRQCDDPRPLYGGAECPNSPEGAEEEQSCTDSCSVKLIGGNGESSGNVYAVNRNGFYGPVCDDYWDYIDATVVCR